MNTGLVALTMPRPRVALERTASRDAEPNDPRNLHAPPESSGIVWQLDAGRGEIVLPPSGTRAWSVLLSLAACLTAALGITGILALTEAVDLRFDGSRAAGWLVACLFVLVAMALFAAAAASTRVREAVGEHHDGLCYRLEACGLSWGHRFLCKRTVEEVSVEPRDRGPASEAVPGSATEVVVRSPYGVLRLASHVDADAQRWVAAAIRLLVCR